MRICPKCRTTYPAKGRATCAKDGTRLIDAREFADAQADPLLGRIIGGRFHIQDRVGTGGMGTVYRASQSGLDRNVALKILKKELNWDQDTVTRFHREAKAMSRLTHANTVRVFDFGETQDGLLFFVMELLEGELLTSRVERDGAVDVRDAIKIAQQVLASLHEAHSKGIIHRDLKPDNIYLAQVEGHALPVVKVLDFGIAKIFEGDQKIDQLETQAGTVFGTPRYMSPEQAQGKPLDPRSDLYSVGILLYHMLTGHPPFLDDDAVVVMAKHIREKPQHPRRAAPDRPITGQLERVVLRAIEKDASKRFRSAEEFERKLEECVPQVQAAIRNARAGRTSGFRALLRDLPRVPLAIGGAIVAAAFLMALYLVASSGEAEAGTDRLLPPPSTETGQGPAEGRAPEGPTAARAPAGTEGVEVRVTTEPRGAEVWADGSFMGTTPYQVRLRPQAHLSAELLLDGFEPEPIELVAGAPPALIELTPSPEEPPASGATAEARDPDTPSSTRRLWRRQRPRGPLETMTMAPTEVQPTGAMTAPTQMRRDPYEEW